MLDADKLLAKYTQKSANITFKQQQEMKVKLVEAADGDQSDYESDYEDMSSLEDPTASSRQEIKLEGGQRRIFKYLTVLDKLVKLPD